MSDLRRVSAILSYKEISSSDFGRRMLEEHFCACGISSTPLASPVSHPEAEVCLP